MTAVLFLCFSREKTAILFSMERKDVFAGYWYPSDKDELHDLIAFQPEHGARIRSAILPHAGLFFSHRGIAHYLARVDHAITRVIILSPSHYFYLKPNEMLGSRVFASARTPLGVLSMVPLEGAAFGGEMQIQREHAVEMVLPGLKEVLPDGTVSMGLVNQVDEDQVERLAGLILGQMDDHTSLIASSDFTHYGEGFHYIPYGPEISDEVRDKVGRHDRELAGLLALGEWRQALRLSIGRHSTVCGIAPSVIASCVNSHLGLVGEIADSYDSFGLSGGGESFVSYVTVLWRNP